MKHVCSYEFLWKRRRLCVKGVTDGVIRSLTLAAVSTVQVRNNKLGNTRDNKRARSGHRLGGELACYLVGDTTYTTQVRSGQPGFRNQAVLRL